MKRLFIILIALLPLTLHAQCPETNTAFSTGETLVYDLYFNWKFVWVKVGSASMNVGGTYYDGAPAYRCNLITRGNSRADKLFVMRDTLQSIVTTDLVPRYYRKGANEGGQYRVDEVWYSYPGNGHTSLHQRYRNRKGEIFLNDVTLPTCVYDMMSMMLRARSFEGSQYKKGDRIHFLMADGDDVEQQVLVFRGREEFKMEGTGTRYRCIVLSFVEKDDKGVERDIITFYVTDDKNHLPVRLDLNLRFGSAKAFLTGARGVRNPQTARIK